MRDEEEYRIVIKISGRPTKEKGKRDYLRDVQRYREVDNNLFPYIAIKMMNPEDYINSVILGYLNQSEIAIKTMRDFLDTLPGNIRLKKAKFSLRR